MNKKIGIFVLFALFIFSLFVPLVTADTAPLLDDGLVLYLPFDESVGLVANDLSVNNNDGTLTSATFGTGYYNNGVVFGASGDNKVLTNYPVYTGDAFTVTLWFKRTGDAVSTYHALAACLNGQNGYSHRLILNSAGTSILAQLENNTSVYTATKSGLGGDNTFHFYGMVYNGSYLSIIFDGQQYSSTYVVPPIKTAGYVFRVGSIDTNTFQSNGIEDDLRVYNRALSQTEITFLYENPQSTPTPAPSATPIPQDMATSAIMSTIILVILVIVNIVFLGVVHSAMVRFLFALLTLMIGIASLTVQDVTFNPYLQMVTVVMSLLCMVLAAKAKG